MVSAPGFARKRYIVKIAGINWESGTDLWPYTGVINQTKIVLGEQRASMYQAAAIRALKAFSLTDSKLLVDIALSKVNDQESSRLSDKKIAGLSKLIDYNIRHIILIHCFHTCEGISSIKK